MQNINEILLFDMDRTMYPPEKGPWNEINKRINEFLCQKLEIDLETAITMRKKVRKSYHTTVQAAVAEFGLDMDEYLAYVHDFPLEEHMSPNPGLRAKFLKIPQRKIAFTNASKGHATRILEYLNILDLFEDIMDITTIKPYSKFQLESFPIALHYLKDPDPSTCVMIDDEIRILDNASAAGLKTLLVNQDPSINTQGYVQINSINEIITGLQEIYEFSTK